MMSRETEPPAPLDEQRLDELLGAAEVLADEYSDFDAHAGLEAIARQVLWDNARSLQHRAEAASQCSGADSRPPLPWRVPPHPIHEWAGQELDAISNDVIRNIHAISAMGLLTEMEDLDDLVRLDPEGALVFACLLHLARRSEAARFWWQFAAGAGSATAAHCLFLHHLQHSELRDARHWRAQVGVLKRLGSKMLTRALGADLELPGTAPAGGLRDFVLIYDWEVQLRLEMKVFSCPRAGLRTAGADGSGCRRWRMIIDLVRDLEPSDPDADADDEFGPIPLPAPDLAAELEECAAAVS